jgi:prepilin-type N-terminal cleavage/methylation domain-containing protein
MRQFIRQRVRSAYTLIELLIVIALLGMAGALLVPNLVGRDSMTTQAAVRRAISDIVFAQSDALAHQELRRVQFLPDGRGYCLIRVTDADFTAAFDEASADYISDPLAPGGMTNYVMDFTADERFLGVTISEINLDGGSVDYFTFDEIGGTVLAPDSPGTGGSFKVNGPGVSFQINIAPFTGKLTVQQL